MSQKIKWGVIGSGGIARRRTIPEGIIAAHNAELSIVYDVNAEINQEVAQEFNAESTEDFARFLASDIQAVYIATPVAYHSEQAIACAKAGKHVLCEKPLGMSVEEIKKMISISKDCNIILGAAFMMRFQSQHRKALEMIQNGDIGKPVFGRAQLSCWYPANAGGWRQDPSIAGGGALIDMGGHCINLLEMFFGKVKKLSCFINNSVQDYKSEDSAVVNLFFENGAMGVVDNFFCIPDNSSKNVLELYGSKGGILAKDTIGQGEAGEMVAYLEDSNAGYDAKQERGDGEPVEIKPVPINTYRAEIEEFSKSIISGKRPTVDAQVALENQIILEACYKSAKTDKVIDISKI